MTMKEPIELVNGGGEQSRRAHGCGFPLDEQIKRHSWDDFNIELMTGSRPIFRPVPRLWIQYPPLCRPWKSPRNIPAKPGVLLLHPLLPTVPREARPRPGLLSRPAPSLPNTLHEPLFPCPPIPQVGAGLSVSPYPNKTPRTAVEDGIVFTPNRLFTDGGLATHWPTWRFERRSWKNDLTTRLRQGARNRTKWRREHQGLCDMFCLRFL